MIVPRLLAMARTSTTHRNLRGVGNNFMARTKSIRNLRGVRNICQSQHFQMKKLDIASCTFSQEVLNRVQIVTEVSESKDIVENIIAMGQPIAVDMEGLVEGTTSMVQVCDVERNISLFRTGLNPSLYWDGGLARLLQSQEVMKIMHASTTDCLSVYKDKVKLWNLYDTAVAFKVLEYQQRGTSMYSSQLIGFNALCQHFGLPENPLKGRLKDVGKAVNTIENLDDETLLYCAWDVDPLHQIYEMLSSSISPSYSHLVNQLSEIEIIRALDPSLAKMKNMNLRNIEVCNMFLSGLPSSLAPPDLYAQLSHISGHKHIYYSDIDGTANIILDSRDKVVKASKSFSDWGGNFGNEAKCKLVVKAHANETVTTANLDYETENAEEKDVKESLDPIICRKIVENLLVAKCPVVVDFLLYPDCSAVEIYVGTKHNIKLVITQKMVEEGGLGKLFSSNIVKVIPRVDTANVYSALKLLNSFSVNVRGGFEISTAVKALDYLDHGQSLFKQQSRSVLDMGKSLGLPMSTTKLHWHYIAYLHLLEVIPTQFMGILAEITEAQLGAGIVKDRSEYIFSGGAHNRDRLEYKYKLRQLKSRLDGRTLHLRLIGPMDNVMHSRMKELVTTVLLSKDLAMVEYMDMGRCSILELSSSQAVKTVKEALEKLEQSSELRFTVSSPQELKTVIEKPSKAEVDLRALELTMTNNVAKLNLSSELSKILG